MIEPYLFQFRRKCTSPRKFTLHSSYYYDERIDMVVDVENAPAVLAIVSNREPGPVTKKADIEKGEDEKDRWLWR